MNEEKIITSSSSFNISVVIANYNEVSLIILVFYN